MGMARYDGLWWLSAPRTALAGEKKAKKLMEAYREAVAKCPGRGAVCGVRRRCLAAGLIEGSHLSAGVELGKVSPL